MVTTSRNKRFVHIVPPELDMIWGNTVCGLNTYLDPLPNNEGFCALQSAINNNFDESKLNLLNYKSVHYCPDCLKELGV